jgi:hypothetical protein
MNQPHITGVIPDAHGSRVMNVRRKQKQAEPVSGELAQVLGM